MSWKIYEKIMRLRKVSLLYTLKSKPEEKEQIISIIKKHKLFII